MLCPFKHTTPATLFAAALETPCGGITIRTGQGVDEADTCPRCWAVWSWDSKEKMEVKA